MNVIEPFGIRRKGEAAEIATVELVWQSLPCLDIKQLERSGTLAALLDLIKQQASIGGNAQWLYCRIGSGAPLGRINEHLVGSFQTITNANTGLLLPWQTLAKEIPTPELLQRVIRFNIKKFTNAFPNLFTPGDKVKIRTRILHLCRNPIAGTG